MENSADNHQKRNIFIVITLALLITLPVIPVLFYRYGINEPAQTNKTISVEIKSGSSVSQISLDLKDAGLINSPALFKIYLRINNLGSKMQAGVFSVPPMTSMKKLVEILQFGRNDVTITYIEGWRVEQLAEILTQKLKNVDYKEFVVEARKFEGYLFPDTYYINIDAEQDEVMEILKDTFEEKTKDLLSNKSLRSAGLTKDEAVILASIIEREAVKFEDRQIIAGILISRMEIGAKIEADATTQYAIALDKHCVPANCRVEGAVCDLVSSVAICKTGLEQKYLDDIKWWPQNLTTYDLDFDSLYNTRKVGGLPPTPISSVSLSALEAVINHIETDYYFYLTDGDGVTHYATTSDEHVNNINTYLR
ncbi:MAG: endolytic transglycosylase MltG [Bacteroidales bacterium]|nr:endolytic transglycosylase MltG [Bacteroidales bacterium]